MNKSNFRSATAFVCIMTSEEREICPLCMESMEADDLAFFPCDCRYQVCRFCWAKIINEENGLCPACRKEYNSEKPAIYRPISETEDPKGKSNRKRKDNFKKSKLSAEMLKLLPELRVVQPNLIFVVGLPAWICKDKEILKGSDYFGRFGKVFKVEINQNQTFGGPQGQPSFSAYITFCRSDDAMRSIRELDQSMLHGRPLRVSLGTTKYCSQFLRGAKCTKHECMYLHELGDPEASFTKEEMQAGKHTEYMNKLLSDYNTFATSTTTNSAQDVGASDSVSVAVPPKNDSRVAGHVTSASRTRLVRSSAISPTKSTTHSRPQSRQLQENEFHSNGHVAESRGIVHCRAEYSSKSSTSESNGDCAPLMSKTNVWNRHVSACEYVPEEISDDVDGLTHSYSNRFETTEYVSRPHQKSADSRRTFTNRNDHPRSLGNRKATAHKVFSGVTRCYPHTSINSNNTPGERHSSGSPEPEPATTFGNEPVDIDFDPFQESQQGLAELLAAEVNRLVVSDDPANSRVPHGANSHIAKESSDVLNFSGSHLLTSNGLDGSIPEYSPGRSRLPNYPWIPTLTRPDGENCGNFDSRGAHVSDLFNSSIYPPPGFEENMGVLQQCSDPSVFSTSTSNLGDHCLSDPPCSPISPLSMGFNNNNGSSNHQDGPSFSFSHSSSNVPCKLDAFNFEANSQPKIASVPNSSSLHFNSTTAFRPYTTPVYTPPSPSLRSDSQQALANLFTAAFNTASAILNNRPVSATDGAPSAASKSAVTFDLNGFISQLCRQSPFFSSLNQPINEWGLTNGLNNASGCLVDSFVNTSAAAAAAAALSAASPSLFSPVRFQLRSGDILPTEDYRRSGEHTFMNCSTSSGLSKPATFTYQATSCDVSTEKRPFGSDDLPPSSDGSTPANPVSPNPVAANWKSTSSPTDLLQQIWQSGPTVQPLFDPQLSMPFGFAAQSSLSVGSVSHSQREPSSQPASHSQSAE
ncbi:unnamed protein product [Dicrocoelium dendriticum]|nr:unnamed protein product [Dicrocoelium dendriticum]